jgi:hypothetical protein
MIIKQYLPLKMRFFQCARCEDKACLRKREKNKIYSNCHAIKQNDVRKYKSIRTKKID